MSRVSNTLLLLAIVVLLNAVLYAALARPFILQWGATAKEAGEVLPGDELAPFASSTRAITINAPRGEVWKWLVQLGGDRGGFYSYTILENLLGYDNDNVINIVPEFQEMNLGRIVPSTPPPYSDSSKEVWKVVQVEPGRAFVLQGWGAFVLREAGPAQTRFIVRTHGWDTPTLTDKIAYFFAMPLHFLMERRMLLGIKARAEAGPGAPLSPLADYLWLGGVFLSALGILALIVLARGSWQALAPVVFSTLWLGTCLVAAPRPVYALTLLGVVTATAVWFARRNLGPTRLKASPPRGA